MKYALLFFHGQIDYTILRLKDLSLWQIQSQREMGGAKKQSRQTHLWLF